MSAGVADVLRDALALIEDERNWCGDEPTGIRRDEESRPVAWCSIQALQAVSPIDAVMAAHALAVAAGCDSLMTWNDAPERTHAEVVAAFKDAIAAEEWSE